MGPSAPFWSAYLEETQSTDKDLVREWKDSIDVLLPFAGLFCAIVTAFVIEIGKRFQIDYDTVNAALLHQLLLQQPWKAEPVAGSARADPTTLGKGSIQPVPSATVLDVWIYGLWMASLVCSISTALMATIARQWIQYYVATTPGTGTLQHRGHIRHLRFTSLERWSVCTVVRILPLIIHLAVLLFACRLSLFLLSLNKTITLLTGVANALMFTIYAGTVLLSLAFPRCPYRTPLAGWFYSGYLYFCRAQYWFDRLRFETPRIKYPKKRDFAWPQGREAKDLGTQCDTIDIDAVVTMFESTNANARAAAAQAIGGLSSDAKLYKNLIKNRVHTSLIQVLENHAPLQDSTGMTTARLFWSSIRLFMISIPYLKKIRKVHESSNMQQQLLEHAIHLLAFCKAKGTVVGLDADSPKRHPIQSDFLHFALSQRWDDDKLFTNEVLSIFLRIFFNIYGASTFETRQLLCYFYDPSPSLRWMWFQKFLEEIRNKEPKLYHDLTTCPWYQSFTVTAHEGIERTSSGPSRRHTSPTLIAVVERWRQHHRGPRLISPTPQRFHLYSPRPYSSPSSGSHPIPPGPIRSPSPAATLVDQDEDTSSKSLSSLDKPAKSDSYMEVHSATQPSRPPPVIYPNNPSSIISSPLQLSLSLSGISLASTTSTLSKNKTTLNSSQSTGLTAPPTDLELDTEERGTGPGDYSMIPSTFLFCKNV